MRCRPTISEISSCWDRRLTGRLVPPGFSVAVLFVLHVPHEASGVSDSAVNRRWEGRGTDTSTDRRLQTNKGKEPLHAGSERSLESFSRPVMHHAQLTRFIAVDGTDFSALNLNGITILTSAGSTQRRTVINSATPWLLSLS